MPRLRWIGLVPKLSAMAGSAVVMTVPSRFSMNRAQATIKGTIIERGAADADGMRKTKGKSRARRRRIAVPHRATGAQAGVDQTIAWQARAETPAGDGSLG